MDDKDLIKKMKRNLRKGTRRKEMKNNGRVSYPDCSLCFSLCFFPSFSVGKSFFPVLPWVYIFRQTTKPSGTTLTNEVVILGCLQRSPLLFPLSLFFLSLSLPASLHSTLPPSRECRSIVLIANVLVGHPTIPSSFFIQGEDEPRLMEAERHFLGKQEESDWKWWENRAAPVFIIKITSLCAENL